MSPWGLDALPETFTIGLKPFVQFDEALCLYLMARSGSDPALNLTKFKALADYADSVRQGFTESGKVPLAESIQSVYLAIANAYLHRPR